VKSSGSADLLALDRGLPTTAADVAALRRLSGPRRIDLDDYLRFLRSLEPPPPAALRARRGSTGLPFSLPTER
jgi:hypothetical protein